MSDDISLDEALAQRRAARETAAQGEAAADVAITDAGNTLPADAQNVEDTPQDLRT